MSTIPWYLKEPVELHRDTIQLWIGADLFTDGVLEVSTDDTLIARTVVAGDTGEARTANARHALSRILGHAGNSVEIRLRGVDDTT